MVEYKGTIFGFNYDIEFETDEEFVKFIVDSLRTLNPLLPKIMDALLNESEEFKELKEKK